MNSEPIPNNETDMYHILRDGLLEFCHRFKLESHIVRIESNLTQQGIPDLYCCIDEKSFWIECKFQDYPLSAMQLSFAKQEIVAGGKVFIIRYRNDKWLIQYEGLIASSIYVIMSYIAQEMKLI